MFLVGSIAPDLDMLWFYLVNNRGHHHHSYLTHRPAIWAVIALVGVLWRPLLWLGLGGLLHMALDSIVGAIAWLWPLSDTPTTLIFVPAVYDFWVTNFILHRTFAIEILVCLAAGYLFFTRRRRT